MAELYAKVRGRELQEFVARIGPVQAELERRAFEVGVRAEERLLEHRLQGHASIDVFTLGNIDHYVALDDTAGDQAALSIEYGRAGYIDPETGETYGAMEGLFILTEASNLRRDRSRRLPKVRARRSNRRAARS